MTSLYNLLRILLVISFICIGFGIGIGDPYMKPLIIVGAIALLIHIVLSATRSYRKKKEERAKKD